MIVVSLADIEAFELSTPWGRERAIRYLGKTFLPTGAFNNIDDAIAACRRDLDGGLLSIIVREKDKISVWRLLPSQAQFQVTKELNNRQNIQNRQPRMRQ